jgi:hypothetical protein
MSAQRERIIAGMRPKHNDICIGGGLRLVRLVGFHEDDEDYYYHLRYVCGSNVYESAVGTLITLRGKLSQKEYDDIEYVFTRNGCPPSQDFLISSNVQGSVR